MDSIGVTAVIALTELQGGGTFLPDGSPAKGLTGFMVGGIVPSKVFAWGLTDKAVRDAIRDYAREHRNLLRQPSHYLGTWVDDSGQCHLDISQNVFATSEAIALGIVRNELAIWDNAAGKEVAIAPFRNLLVDAYQRD